MSDQIKTITERSSFESILKKFFQNNACLKTKNGDIKVQFFGYSDEVAAFKVPYLKNLPENCLIFSRHGDNTIHALVKCIEKQEDTIFLFRVEKFQVIIRAREENRKSIDVSAHDNDKSKNIIFITNIISYSIIQNSISMESKKIERIRDYLRKEMSQAFNNIKIFFCNEGKGDSRMTYFFTNKRPIFVPNINNITAEGKGTEKINQYLNNIYSKDIFLQGRKEYISEISVPLLYKMKMTYGYIQVNNTTMFSSSSLDLVKKFALLTDELLNKETVFPKEDGKLIVSNISKNGLGVVFKERKFIRNFKENNYVYFDILLPGKKTASVLAMVRNITLMENNIIRVGCSIEEIDALSEVNYDEFLESIPQPKSEDQPEDKAAAKEESKINESLLDTEEQNNTP